MPGHQTLLVHSPFVPRLAGVLPLLLLRVWKGQQGQHGEGKEGRLCPAWPPGCPEGKGVWRAVEQRKRVSRKKRHFPSSFLFLVFSPGLLFLHPLLSSFLSFFILSHFVPVSFFKFSSHWCCGSDFHYLCGPLGPNSCQVCETELKQQAVKPHYSKNHFGGKKNHVSSFTD